MRARACAHRCVQNPNKHAKQMQTSWWPGPGSTRQNHKREVEINVGVNLRGGARRPAKARLWSGFPLTEMLSLVSKKSRLNPILSLFRDMGSRFKSRLQRLTNMWPWSSCSFALCFGFLICKKEVTVTLVGFIEG